MDPHQEFLNQILFVIVVYKQEPEKCAAFKSLCTSISQKKFQCHISFYDNSPSLISFTNFTQHIIHFHHNPSNPGLSRSYNQAYHKAVSLDKKWLFLLDQDTSFSFDYLRTFNLAVQQFPNEILFAPIVKDKIGFLSPFRFSWGKGQRIPGVSPGIISLHRLQPINSGMMIRRDAFERVDGFEESIKLDFSDHAFIKKIKLHYKNFVVVNATFQQDFFDATSTSESVAVHRFRFYYEGSRAMGRIYGPAMIYYYRLFIRAIYLSVYFKSTSFVRILLNQMKITNLLKFKNEE